MISMQHVSIKHSSYTHMLKVAQSSENKNQLRGF